MEFTRKLTYYFPDVKTHDRDSEESGDFDENSDIVHIVADYRMDDDDDSPLEINEADEDDDFVHSSSLFRSLYDTLWGKAEVLNSITKYKVLNLHSEGTFDHDTSEGEQTQIQFLDLSLLGLAPKWSPLLVRDDYQELDRFLADGLQTYDAVDANGESSLGSPSVQRHTDTLVLGQPGIGKSSCLS